MTDTVSTKKGFGTAPVFFTAISTILGAILFLRFGFAVGEVGFWGTIGIVIIGHLVTIPTAMALAEIATNQKVEGGGEYYIISRSFGLNIGATIGIALYFSQAISVAFYVIAFTEAFEPLFNWVSQSYGIDLPRQVISIPAMIILGIIILKKGADLGVKALYFVVAILFISLILFFVGTTTYGETHNFDFSISENFRTSEIGFFAVFAIIFPAFTGMTAGVGLSGDLQNPSRSIPRGTLFGTVAGMIVYIFIAWKLAASASPSELVSDQFVMGKIALFGAIAIPIGLAASTISSAIGSILVAPRTLQALGGDKAFPFRKLNLFLAKGVGINKEPYNTTLITAAIAMVFVAAGNVNAVAEIISMFFMVTYGALNLISFLYHFGGDPSYRPTFKSIWPLSLLGFILCVFLMFQINTIYAILALVFITLIYIGISFTHKEEKGMESIFQGALFQVSRRLQVYFQSSKTLKNEDTWRPSAICISRNTFQRKDALDLLKWISYKYGFGTYIHLIDGYFSSQKQEEADEQLVELIRILEEQGSNVLIDTLISPSFTSAIAQVVQLPSISGKENNLFLFEFSKNEPDDVKDIIENYKLARTGRFDVCILASSGKPAQFKNGIHIWITSRDYENTNLMILLSYVLLGHPDWKKGQIRIFDVGKAEELEERKEKLLKLIKEGRLSIAHKNVEFLDAREDKGVKAFISERSSDAGLTIIGFRNEQIKHQEEALFSGYEGTGNILFVNAINEKEIK